VRPSARTRANRANAKLSTGPKSKAGKGRAAQNAFKHGLSIPAGMLTECSPAVEAYVAQLIGEGASSQIRAAAIEFAEAQVDVDRVRRARQGLYQDPGARLMRPTIREAQEATKQKLRYLNTLFRVNNKLGLVFFAKFSKEELDARMEALTLNPMPLSLEESMGELAPKLTKLWRYEKRALSRRDKAAERLRILCAPADAASA
jgi:hypothetical protein